MQCVTSLSVLGLQLPSFKFLGFTFHFFLRPYLGPSGRFPFPFGFLLYLPLHPALSPEKLAFMMASTGSLVHWLPTWFALGRGQVSTIDWADFSGDPEAKSLHFQCRGCRFDP